MVFSDLFFLFVFLPAFILVYTLCALADRRLSLHREHGVHTMKNIALVVFSLLFYSWGEPVYVLLMAVTVALNYLAARVMTETRHRKAALWGGLAANLCVLGSFKYLGFFARTLNSLGLEVAVPEIALPIGISFYIFQSISYLVDVYRNDSPAQRRYRDLLLYIAMFPQLIAGPIVRYGTIAAEINDRRVSAADIADGVFRFMIGLGKKVIIANQLGEVADQFLGSGVANLSTGGAWVGIVAFALQIYFDFSGYSDMAIGMGRCIGFHFRENFDHPYCCTTITDFWRRWHISLGSFFRDYVYIPMGGNRRRQVLNILVVWFLTGMWHGASWNFIMWGVYFGLIVLAEKYTVLRVRERVPRVVLHLYSLALLVIGWGIFYFEDLGQMGTFFGALAGGGAPSGVEVESAVFDRFWLWIAAIMLCMPVRGTVARLSERLTGDRVELHRGLTLTARMVLSGLALIVSVAMLIGATNNAFLYTRF